MRERDIFLAALDLSPDERVAYLTDQCGEDADLRRRVDALLLAHAAAGSFLADPHTPVGGTATFDPGTRSRWSEGAPPVGEAGQVIAGRYKLIERIGEGGMGSVWLAEQTEPVKRKVAVKLIKAGLDSKTVLARFEAERQALALMDHPHIAKVLDGGVHDGRPYFVMELVKGVPITEFCDARRLTPQQRLELFVPVCQAIQHAHQKGVIHRDVKPANVLVALYDDKPVPKVIDFGVAKATGPTLTEHTLNTGFGGVVGTPQYMSPEQATFNNLDIDTRSDVYSLGVLLYELLAGSPPFKQKELEKRGLLEILRVVREEEPPKPSTKLSTADALPSLAASRGTEPKKLAGLLRNELDWIVMKALEKDRTRRYETANGFAADVQRYLSGEPVLAHPPSWGYRVEKFLHRHRGSAIATALVVVALLAGFITTVHQAGRASVAEKAAWENARQEGKRRQEAQRAEEKAQAEYLKAEVAKDRAEASERVVLAQRNRLEAALDQHREVLVNFGVTLLKLGRREEALKLYADADAILDELATAFPDTPRYRFLYAKALNKSANVLMGAGQLDRAEQQYKRSLALRLDLVTQSPEERLYLLDLNESRVNLALLLEGRRRSGEATEQLAAALRDRERLIALFPTEHQHRAALGAQSHLLGNMVCRRGECADSLAWYDRGIKHLSAAIAADPNLGREHLYLARVYRDRAAALDRLHRPHEASADWEKAAAAVLSLTSRVDTSKWGERIELVGLLSRAGGRGPARATEYADRAMELLTKAVKAGYKDAAHMKTDPDLDPLREREDFKKLLADLEAKFPPKKEVLPPPRKE